MMQAILAAGAAIVAVTTPAKLLAIFVVDSGGRQLKFPDTK